MQANFASWCVAALAACVLSIPPAGADGVNILIAYHSASGHTRQLAEAIGKGAQSVADVTVTLKQVQDATPADFLRADAVIIGSPVHNGNLTPEVLTYISSWPFDQAPYSNKVGAAFVTAGGISAGEEAAMHSIHRAMLIFGMVIVGGSDWRAAFGASAIVSEGPFNSKQNDNQIAPEFTSKGFQLGSRVARIASKLAK